MTGYVYMTASQKRGTLYIGVTSAPLGRMSQHREGAIPGFTARHGVKRLVFIEFHATMESAILREKQLKRWHRQWKINLIEQTNRTWRDLALDYGFDALRPWKLTSVDAETSSA